MKELFSLISNKYFLWIVIAFCALGTFGLNKYTSSKYEEQLETYKRQLAGQLSDKEKELQAMHSDLGLAKSELLTKEQLAKKLQKEKDEVDKKFQEFVKTHNLEIASKDETIAKLKQQISGGNSGTVVTGCGPEQLKLCTIEYNWQDPLGRFKLKDPNIFVQNNEIFTSEQYFKVYGEIWKQKNSSLQTKRLILREMQKMPDGTYKEIAGAKAEIIDSEFVYSNEPADPSSWRDLFRLRFIMGADIKLFPTPGKSILNTGIEFFRYKSFGLNSHTVIDFRNVASSEQHLGVSYTPTIFNSQLNLATGLSIGTPIAKAFNEYTLSLDFIFFINN